MGWLSVSNCCRDVSSFVLLTCVQYARMIPSIILLGNSRDLTCRGTTTSCRCYCRLFRLFRLFWLFWLFQLFRLFQLFQLFWLFQLFQLLWGGDIDTVLPFAFALAFSILVFVVVWSTLARVLELAIFGRIHLVCIFEPIIFGCNSP